MIPSKEEWSTWNAFEWSAYVAQALAPFALLFSVIFAYLSWREAAEARDLQERMFVAQNPPRIEFQAFDATTFSNGDLGVWLIAENEGTASGEITCAKVFIESELIQDCQDFAYGRVPVRPTEIISLPVSIIIPAAVFEEREISPIRSQPLLSADRWLQRAEECRFKLIVQVFYEDLSGFAHFDTVVTRIGQDGPTCTQGHF